MKKYIFGLFFALISVAMFTACSAEEGTNPGGDSEANVVLYQYTVDKPYDTDADTKVRIVANSATSEAYSLVESKADYETRLAQIGQDAYNSYVVNNGQKIDGISGSSSVDKYYTDLSGDVVITVVAVGNGKYTSKNVSFKALAWENVTSGTYYFGVSAIKSIYKSSIATTLQKCTNEDGLYRLTNVYGEGYNLKFTLTGDKSTDDSGEEYSICHVAAQSIGLTYGSYGELGVRDVATWQNSQSYLVYNMMYSDGYCQFWNQYYVTAGNLGYGYDYFVPSQQ